MRVSNDFLDPIGSQRNSLLRKSMRFTQRVLAFIPVRRCFANLDALNCFGYTHTGSRLMADQLLPGLVGDFESLVNLRHPKIEADVSELFFFLIRLILRSNPMPKTSKACWRGWRNCNLLCQRLNFQQFKLLSSDFRELTRSPWPCPNVCCTMSPTASFIRPHRRIRSEQISCLLMPLEVCCSCQAKYV